MTGPGEQNPGGSAKPPGSVLFICTYNAVRSPMAAAFLRHLHGSRIFVASAGVREADMADGFMQAVMAELGLDLSKHRPTTLEDLDDENFDLIVSLSPEAHHRALEFTRTLAVDVQYWPTEDPTVAEGSREERLAAYRHVRDRIHRRVLDAFPPQGGSGV